MSLGTTISGAIKSTSQSDDYTFAGTTGEIVYLETETQDCANSGLQWQLLAPDGYIEKDNGVCGDIGRVVLSSAGTWTVRVYSTGGPTGPYAFVVLPVPATTTTPIPVGEEVAGLISHVGQQRDYSFAATAGEVVDLETKTQDCANSGLQWQLLAPDGYIEKDNGVCGDIGRVVLSSAGTWTVRVYSAGRSIGPYAFVVRTSEP